MYDALEQWINGLALNAVPENVEAFCFNLYDGCDNQNWSMDLIGAPVFDPEDSDWACDEVTNFGSRKQVFRWTREATWEIALEEMLDSLNRYLKEGRFAVALKSRSGVGVGFTDGDLHILYQK